MPLTWMRGSPADRSGGSGRATLGAGAAGRTGAAGGGLGAALLRHSAGDGEGAGTGAATGRGGAAVAADRQDRGAVERLRMSGHGSLPGREADNVV